MIRLAFRAPADQAEIVLAALIELAPSGVEEVDGEGFTEFALYGAPGELPSFPEGAAEVGGVVVQVSGREVPDDWAERWKRFHRPVLIGGKVYVRPPWEEPAVRPGVVEIVIDPGQAFGTGTHPTTAMCLELMLDLKAHGSFADLGCGSGVLAIAAAKLGFGPVTAIDAERESVRATRINSNVNGVTIDRLERGDLRGAPAPKADVVAANLMRPLLLRVAELWEGEPPATLILSGLLDHEAGEVAAAFAPLRERKRLSSLGWSALLLS
ncbi:MAG TPA: 50S ribosomal protein L11 methyltransferase [Thermoleophilaceae bacterium]